MVNLNGHDSRKGINNDDGNDDDDDDNNNNNNDDNINDDNINDDNSINSTINSIDNSTNDNDSDNSTNPATNANTSTINGTDPFDSPSYDLSRVQQSIDDGFHILTKTNPEMRFNIKRVIPACFNGYESMDEYLRDVLPNVTKMRKKYCYNEFYDISRSY
ncbi:hypothetical protein THOM_2889 [Trachipleistophora hominis]|uniref:Uncharacterized protein n=1 Tax=Trachipleistophora hominis TaxID=72359 RepID=L7JT47_TRAHO|nr:hypothetical protein THOM_2889 [Trachipleistophora hominis]